MKQLRLTLHPMRMIPGIFMLFGMLMIAPVAWAGPHCVPYSETLETSGPTLAGPLNGIATTSINNGALQQAQFTTILLGSVRDKGNGILAAKFADFYLFPDGQVLTAVAKTLLDLNTGTFTGKIRFTGGTGIYESARGRAKLEATGAFLPDGSIVTSSMTNGKICRLGMPHNPDVDSDEWDSD